MRMRIKMKMRMRPITEKTKKKWNSTNNGIYLNLILKRINILLILYFKQENRFSITDAMLQEVYDTTNSHSTYAASFMDTKYGNQYVVDFLPHTTRRGRAL